MIFIGKSAQIRIEYEVSNKFCSTLTDSHCRCVEHMYIIQQDTCKHSHHIALNSTSRHKMLIISIVSISPTFACVPYCIYWSCEPYILTHNPLVDVFSKQPHNAQSKFQFSSVNKYCSWCVILK